MGVWSRPRWATVLAAVVLSAVASGWPGTSAGLATALAADTTAGTVQSPVRARLRETSARAAALESIRTKDLQRHAAFLADDSLEGREGGSRGGHAAGLYLAREFHRLGLAGGNGNSYIQGFESNQRNILAKIEGEDEQLKDEYIVLSAHYDHVGYGTPQNSYGPTGRIHNGADDNASGTAALLEIAEAFKEAGLRPRRSILFALWDGEEKGLLGSLHWVRNPTVPLNRVRLVINMDMIGRLRNDRLEVYGVRTAPGLRLLLAQQNTENLLLTFNWKMKADSDHHPFFERGVPVIMLHTGLHEQYHRPSDDVELLNLEGMHRVSRLALRLLDTAANADGLPGFRNQSTRETEEMQQASERPLEPARPRLGVTWDVGETGAEGLRVLRLHRGSAAEKSGLREGDRVLEFGGVKVDRFETLRRLVLQAQSPVRVKVQRPEEAQPRVLMVELEGPAVRVGLSWRVDDAEPRCVIVNRVLAGSPAEEAGLQVNDRIHEVSGRTFATSEEFLQLVNEVDSSLTLLVEREGRLREVRLERLAPLVAE